MSRAEIRFYVRGTRISVHFTTIALLVWAVLSGYLWEMTLLLSALVTHEVAHFIALRGYGLTLMTVRVFPFGASMEVSGLSGRPHVEVPVALAGPLNNFLLLALGLLLGSAGWGGGYLWDFFLAANLGVALFNLIPALPLDGGRMFRCYLGEAMGVAAASHVLACWGVYWGLGLVAGSIVLALWLSLYVPALGVLGIILVVTALGERGETPILPLGNLYRRRPRRTDDMPPPVEHLSAYGEETVASVSQRLGSYGFAIVWILDRNLRLMGTLTEEELRRAVSSGRADATLEGLLSTE